MSKSNPFTLGYDSDGAEALITEGERESHFQILGSTREGKSKFLEYLVRHDIDRLREGSGVGLCFIDPSTNGDSVNKILAYCAEIDFRKVFLVDPYRLRSHGKIAPINPFNYNRSQIVDSVAYMQDALRVLFGIKDPSDQSNIERYGYHLLNVLHRVKLTLHDTLWWTSRNDFKHYVKREYIYDLLRNDKHAEESITQLNEAFSTETRFKDFQSTIGRISTIFANPAVDAIFGHRNGIDFIKLIEKGYVILVNVSDLDVLQSRLLATVVINQVLQALERLHRHGYGKPFYLYVDEAGEYATRKLARTLELKSKIGIRCILAHQHPGQLEDKRIRDAVETQCKVKAAFYTEAKHREEIVKLLGYGGDVKDRDVAYALSNQKKSHMVIRVGKDSPRVVKVPDTPDATGDVEKFVAELFKSPNYYTVKEIEDDYADRFKGLGEDFVRAVGAAKSDNRTANRPAKGKVRHSAKDPKKDAPKKARRADSNAKPDMAWENLFLEGDGNKGTAD